MKTHTLTVAGIGIAALAAYSAAQLGPLTPPPGPVADTSPSLADIESRAIEIQASLATQAGPWQSITHDGTFNQRDALTVTTNPVIIHKLIVHDGTIVLFNEGSGNVSSGGRVTAGTPIAQATNIYGEGVTVGTTTAITFDILSPLGLHYSHAKFGETGTFTILYREIEP